ncbi:MAG TPA: DoxX family protein [Saprospiraceae bacterium]|nr:DoxX family protein [Saprospiraceae bacterium]
MKPKSIFTLLLRIVAAVIFLQTLFFKFAGAPESKYIFETVGMEPWGRYGSGVVELIASLLLLMPRTVWLGAILGMGVLAGAIFFHLTKLGIEVQGDGGLLFGLALVGFSCCAILLWFYRSDIRLKL